MRRLAAAFSALATESGGKAAALHIESRSFPMPGDSERVEITISSRFENIELVQVIAEHLCETAGMDDDSSHWIGMAVREGIANAIKHGNRLDMRKKVQATFELQDGTLKITIADEGEGFDPSQIGDPLSPQNLMKTSGRGIFYMKTFMDRVDFTFRPGGGTQLVMTKNLAGRGGMATGGGSTARERD